MKKSNKIFFLLIAALYLLPFLVYLFYAMT